MSGMMENNRGRQPAGCVHIYCGDGKGKTTAAVGLAVRAAGRGMRVLILRLLKTDDSGEVAALGKIPEITVIPCRRTFGFVSGMDAETKQEAAAYYTRQLQDALLRAADGHYDMLVLDEIMAACRTGMVPEQKLIDFLDHRPDRLEVVLTGREPSEQIKQRADYISGIRMEKHPYTKGLAARMGIEL